MATFAHPYTDLDNGLIRVDCYKCGYTYDTHKRYTGADRNQEWWLCQSCKYKPTKHISYNGQVCKPWQGDFDDDLLICLDSKGRPYKVGPRSCGHADCVRADHILS